MINTNGKLQEDQHIDLENRAMLYGDALFETMRVQAGKVLFWEDHYFRLMASMRILRMEIPMKFTPEFLEQELLDLVKANALEKQAARVRLTVYRNGGGLYLPDDNTVSYFAFAKALPDPFYTLSKAPYEVELYKDHYVNPDLLSTLKTTNKMIHITGSIYARENGFQNCLLINQHKEVVEGLSGNLFVVKGNTIKTAPLASGCLRGIIRKQLMGIIQLMPEYTLEEAAISPFELQQADELFLTNAIQGIQPITKYRKKEYTATVAEALLRKLNVKARLG
ncbi:aminotransferase class IV [Croceiramulus getboli]|nr:aminotransferase class IV [Flavobacteriaceae bacterium YJPT1-3]